jgi:hypothetical protein
MTTEGRHLAALVVGVEVYKRDTGRAIVVTGAGLAANTRRDARAVWLYTSPSHSKLLGFVSHEYAQTAG